MSDNNKNEYNKTRIQYTKPPFIPLPAFANTHTYTNICTWLHEHTHLHTLTHTWPWHAMVTGPKSWGRSWSWARVGVGAGAGQANVFCSIRQCDGSGNTNTATTCTSPQYMCVCVCESVSVSVRVSLCVQEYLNHVIISSAIALPIPPCPGTTKVTNTCKQDKWHYKWGQVWKKEGEKKKRPKLVASFFWVLFALCTFLYAMQTTNTNKMKFRVLRRIQNTL